MFSIGKIISFRGFGPIYINFILEISGKIIAIEVKSSKTISKDDFKHIYHLKENLQSKFDKGIVFYTGDAAMKLDDDMFALPFGFMG